MFLSRPPARRINDLRGFWRRIFGVFRVVSGMVGYRWVQIWWDGRESNPQSRVLKTFAPHPTKGRTYRAIG
jgi:hypothetical protein